MHAYSTDSKRYRTILAALMGFAIISAWLLPQVLGFMHITLPWWFDAPAVFGFFGIYWNVFDRIAWKWHIGTFYLSDILNFEGEWVGTVTSSHNKQKTRISVSIHQSSSRILIQSQTEDSSSTSIAATVIHEEGMSRGLTYAYENWPKVMTSDSLKPHRGYARLELRKRKIQGEYLTDHHRSNHGRIELKRK